MKAKSIAKTTGKVLLWSFVAIFALILVGKSFESDGYGAFLMAIIFLLVYVCYLLESIRVDIKGLNSHQEIRLRTDD